MFRHRQKIRYWTILQGQIMGFYAFDLVLFFIFFYQMVKVSIGFSFILRKNHGKPFLAASSTFLFFFFALWCEGFWQVFFIMETGWTILAFINSSANRILQCHLTFIYVSALFSESNMDSTSDFHVSYCLCLKLGFILFI